MGAKDGGGSAAHERKKTKKRIKSKTTNIDKMIKEAVPPKDKEMTQKAGTEATESEVIKKRKEDE